VEVKMEKWLLVAASNCTNPAREEEFNHWYDTVHLPDVLETPGILRGTRFKNDKRQEGQWKYLAIYEVETEDIQRTMSRFGEIVTEKWEQGRWSELLATDLYVAFYKQMAPPVEQK
jgi:hypothetical protein